MNQHQTFNRSNSIPTHNAEGTQGFKDEVSMAQLANQLVGMTSTGGSERIDASSQEQHKVNAPKNDDQVLFNAYPRDGYPNYDYVQRLYLQNPHGKS